MGRTGVAAEQTNIAEGTEIHGQFKIPEPWPEPRVARRGTDTWVLRRWGPQGLSG